MQNTLVVWICHRFSARHRSVGSDAKRANTITQAWLQGGDAQGPGFALRGAPVQTAGWRHLQASMAVAGVSPRKLCEDADRRGHIVGVALLGNPEPHTSTLEALEFEKRFLVELHSHEPGVFLGVFDFIPLREMKVARHTSQEYVPHCAASSLTGPCVAELLACDAAPRGTMREAIQAWRPLFRLGSGEAGEISTCLQQWGVLAWAFAQGLWHTVLIGSSARISSDSEFKSWLHEHGRVTSRSGQAQPRTGEPAGFSSARLRQLADHFRQLSTVAMHSPPSGSSDEEGTALEADIAFLEEYASFFDSMGSYVLEGFGRFGSQKRFRAEVLINVFLSQLARNKNMLREMVVRPCKLLFPGGAAKQLVQQAEHIPVPSPPVLSRLGLVLDAAVMMVMREMWDELLAGGKRPSIQLLIDSSPKGGVDWLHMEMF